MAIKGNVGTGVIDIAAADTTVYDPSVTVQRYAVSAASIFNTTLGTLTVSVYVSPNLTSASGKKVAEYVIGSLQSADAVELIGQGFVAQNIIAVGSGVGCNIMLSVTTYDGGD